MADSINVEVKGMDKVMAALKKVSNPEVLCDQALRTTALNSMRFLVENSQTKNPQITGMSNGDTARAWTNPIKMKPGQYQVTNGYKTRGGKWGVVNVLNYGHKELKPAKKYFYIPLNKKAAQKPPGANIPKEFKRATKDSPGDFVFATKIKALPGRQFLKKNREQSSRELTRRIIQAVRAAIK